MKFVWLTYGLILMITASSLQAQSADKTKGNKVMSSNVATNIIMEPQAMLDLGSSTFSVTDTIYLNADSAGYAQLIGSVSGESSVETYITHSSARWFNISFPVNATLNNVKVDNGGSILTGADGNSSQVNIYYYDATTEDNTTNQGTWTQVPNKLAESEGVGYSIYLGPGNFGSLPVTVSSTGGSLIDGAQTIVTGFVGSGGSNNEGWNFIPNPYPSSINWSALRALNAHLNSTYYIGNGDGSIASYNGVVGISGGADSTPTNYVAPMQSFFVQLSSSGNISMTNAIRSLDEEPEKYKLQPDFLKLLVETDSGTFKDEVVIGFRNDYTDGFDHDFDGYKRKHQNLDFHNIYATTNSKAYVFYGISDQFSYKQVTIAFDAANNGSYKIAGDLDQISSDWKVLLEDKLTGGISDLRSKDYRFIHDTSYSKDRFVLHINQPSFDDEEFEKENIYAFIENNDIVIILNDIIDGGKATLFSSDGKRLEEQSIRTGKLKFGENISPGMYIVLLFDNQGNILFRERIIK